MNLGPEYFKQRISKFYNEVDNALIELKTRQSELDDAMDLLKDEIKSIEEDISQIEKELLALGERFETHKKNSENVITNLLHSKSSIDSIALVFENYETQFVENDLEIENKTSLKRSILKLLHELYKTKSEELIEMRQKYLLTMQDLSILSSKILKFSAFDLSEEEIKVLNTNKVDTIEETNPQTLTPQFNEIGAPQKELKMSTKPDNVDSEENKVEIKKFPL